MNEEVEIFIKNFKFKHEKELEYVFLNGNCYFFALILYNRFENANIKLMQIDSHFVTEINGRLYDIRGDVTDICNVPDLIDFEELKNIDETYYNRLIYYCFLKLD